MKKLTAILILIIVAVFGCYWQPPDDYFPVYDEIPLLGFTSPIEIGWWNYWNIQYKTDSISPEYWQSPLQTYSWKTGDCEDFAILMMYFIYRELEGLPEMAIGYYY